MPDALTVLPQAELIAIIYEQHDHIQALERQVAELKSQLDNQGPPKPPLWVKANVPSKPKRQRNKRQHGYARKCDLPTKQIYHAYQVCPDCGGQLGKGSVGYRRQVIELPQVSVEVTEHIVLKRYCFSCQRRVMPKVDLSGIVVRWQAAAWYPVDESDWLFTTTLPSAIAYHPNVPLGHLPAACV